MKTFDYAAPASLPEAIGLLRSKATGVRFLAGGTDLLVQLREGQRSADLVVDLKHIPELTELEFSEKDGLRLGATVPCIRIYRDERISRAYPALADAARIIGGWQIQSRASIGGNLCNSSPAADSIPALIALNASCTIVGPSGTRAVPAAEFCTGPGRNVLEPGEFLSRIDLPPPSPRSGSHYLRFIPRNEMDIAVAGVGAWLRLSDDGKSVDAVRIGLGAVAPTPVVPDDAVRWLTGKPATEASFRDAAERAKSVANPITDLRGPREYRIHLVGVLTFRALAKACERAQQA